MLSRVRIAGFRSLADITLKPGRLTVLIGANGAGKSNVLSMLKLVPLRGLQRKIGEAGGADAVLHYGSKRTPMLRIELDADHDGHVYSYLADLGFAAGDKLQFEREALEYRASQASKPIPFELGSGHSETLLYGRQSGAWKFVWLNAWLENTAHFHFHDTSINSALRTNSRAVDTRKLSPDGGNLAAYLKMLRDDGGDAGRKAFKRINALVRRVAPSVMELSPTAVDSRGDHFRLDWIDDRGEVFGVHQMSDGTLRAVALITALAQPTSKLPSFISIDEPELGLHPAAIGLLAELARSVSHKTQILFATQSTAFLDHFDADEIVVAEREDGATVLRRLEPDRLAGWLDEYSLSEVFEKGVIGGRP